MPSRVILPLASRILETLGFEGEYLVNLGPPVPQAPSLS